MLYEKSMARIVTAFCISGALVMVGCESPQPSATTTGGAKPAPVDNSMNWVSMYYPTGSSQTSVVGVQKGVPREVRLNQPFTYELKVTNLSDLTLHDVAVSEVLSPNVKPKTASPAGEVAENTIKWSLGSLKPDETRVIQNTVVATGMNVATSCASVTYNTMLCASVPVVSPALQVTKAGPAQALRCDDIVYRFTVSNTGTGVIQNVKLSDKLADGLTTKDGQNTIALAVGSLRPSETREHNVQIKATKPGKFSSQATVSDDGGITAASDTVTTVVREPVLKITKTGPDSKFIGRTATYKITVTNSGDGEARDLVVEDSISQGAQFIRASDNAKVAGGKIVWQLGTLQPAASKEITVTVQADQRGVVSGTAEARAFCAAPVSASAQTTFKGIPAILLEVIDVKDPLEVGQDGTYAITATNQGTAPGTNIKIVCTLERSVQYVSSTGSTAGSAEGATVTFTPLASLAPGQKATWNITVKAGKPGDTRFKVSMTSDQLSRPVEETEATNVYE